MSRWLIVGILLVAMCVGQALTPQQVLHQKDSLLGKSITVEGIAAIGLERCTLMACTQEQPCCNSCAANLILTGDGANITVSGEWEGKEVGCEGNDCGLTCWPLEEGKRYSVSGIWNSSLGEYSLELKAFSEAG